MSPSLAPELAGRTTRPAGPLVIDIAGVTKLYQMGDRWFDAFTRRALTDEERARLPCPRQCLHAARVRCADEVFTAPTPADLIAAFAGG